MLGGHGDAMIGGHGGLLPRMQAVEGTMVTIQQAAAMLGQGFVWTRDPGAALVVPTGAAFTLYPVTGALTQDEPDGVWQVTANGTINGPNDVAQRYVVGATIDYHDNNTLKTIWDFLLVRGKDLHTATPTISQRVAATGVTDLFGVGEPDSRALVSLFTHPSTGDLTEYGLLVRHDQGGNITFTPDHITLISVGIGPGTGV